MKNNVFKSIIVFIVVVAMLGCKRTVMQDKKRKRIGVANKPKGANVLFIAIDDLNSWVGCLGTQPDVKTPNIDKLAARGVLFENAYCPAPACCPSRAAMMTGIRPSTSGVYHNNQDWRKNHILKNAETISQHFMRNGYKAVGGGKIFHGPFPDPSSWDEYYPSKNHVRPSEPKIKNRPLNKMPVTRAFDKNLDWGAVPYKADELSDGKVANWAVKELQKRRDKPFFIACGFFKPHLPWFAPKKYFDMYPLDKITLPTINTNDLDDIPAFGRKIAAPETDHAKILKYNQYRQAVQGYLACISYIDDCVGKVIDALDNSPYATNTVVVLWSDHGWHLGEKLHWRKFALWEEATRNPMIIVAPDVTKRDGRCKTPVNLLDIYPTLIELCNLDKNDNLEGVSLVPLLKNPDAEWKQPALTTFGKNNHALRSKRWRYIKYFDGTEELYDHNNDKLEWNNLASDPKYDEVKNELSKWFPKVNVKEDP